MKYLGIDFNKTDINRINHLVIDLIFDLTERSTPVVFQSTYDESRVPLMPEAINIGDSLQMTNSHCQYKYRYGADGMQVTDAMVVVAAETNLGGRPMLFIRLLHERMHAVHACDEPLKFWTNISANEGKVMQRSIDYIHEKCSKTLAIKLIKLMEEYHKSGSNYYEYQKNLIKAMIKLEKNNKNKKKKK